MSCMTSAASPCTNACTRPGSHSSARTADARLSTLGQRRAVEHGQLGACGQRQRRLVAGVLDQHDDPGHRLGGQLARARR